MRSHTLLSISRDCVKRKFASTGRNPMNPDYSRKREVISFEAWRRPGVSHQGSLSRVVAFHKLAVGFIGFEPVTIRESMRAAAFQPHGTDRCAFFTLFRSNGKQEKREEKEKRDAESPALDTKRERVR